MTPRRKWNLDLDLKEGTGLERPQTRNSRPGVHRMEPKGLGSKRDLLWCPCLKPAAISVTHGQRPESPQLRVEL